MVKKRKRSLGERWNFYHGGLERETRWEITDRLRDLPKRSARLSLSPFFLFSFLSGTTLHIVDGGGVKRFTWSFLVSPYLWRIVTFFRGDHLNKLKEVLHVHSPRIEKGKHSTRESIRSFDQSISSSKKKNFANKNKIYLYWCNVVKYLGFFF